MKFLATKGVGDNSEYHHDKRGFCRIYEDDILFCSRNFVGKLILIMLDPLLKTYLMFLLKENIIAEF